MNANIRLRSIHTPETISVIGPVISSAVLSAASEASRLIEIAHRQAEAIVAQANKNAIEIETKTRETVFNRESEKISNVLEQLKLHIQTQQTQFTAIATQVSLAALKKLALQATEQDKLSACISQLVGEISATIPLKLHVSPSLLQEATEILDLAVAQGRAATSYIPIVEDKTLEPGDAALVTPTGARIQCKFKTMVQRLVIAMEVAAQTTEVAHE